MSDDMPIEDIVKNLEKNGGMWKLTRDVAHGDPAAMEVLNSFQLWMKCPADHNAMKVLEEAWQKYTPGVTPCEHDQQAPMETRIQLFAQCRGCPDKTCNIKSMLNMEGYDGAKL